MNKTEFINAVAAQAGLSKVDGKKAVEAMLKTISDEMKKGEKVSILGFGSFSVVEKAARKGVNPKTKQAINIPARKVVKFKAGADLAKIVK
jgi:DNA-binding protein HU-beta